MGLGVGRRVGSDLSLPQSDEAEMGDPSVSIPAPQPVHQRPVWPAEVEGCCTVRRGDMGQNGHLAKTEIGPQT